MAIAYEQGKASDGGSGATSVVLAFTANVKLGSLLLAYCSEYAATGAAMTVTDTQGNTWTGVDAQVSFASIGGTVDYRLWYAIAGSAAANTVTIHLPATNSGNGCIVAEFSGTATTTPLDGTFHGGEQHSVTSGTSYTGTSFTPTAGDLLIAVYSDVNSAETISAASPWTTQAAIWTASGNGDNSCMEYQVSASGSSTAGGWTTSITMGGGQNSLWAAFSPAGGAASPFPAVGTQPRQIYRSAIYRME